MTDTRDDTPDTAADNAESDAQGLACVLAFNANDPSGAGGLTGDVLAMGSVGVHTLPTVTGCYARDTSGIHDFFAFDEEAVSEQARTIAEDVPVQVIKVGFAGSPENLAARSRGEVRNAPAGSPAGSSEARRGHFQGA